MGLGKKYCRLCLVDPDHCLRVFLSYMTYAIIRRWHRGIFIGQADSDHIHHKLLEKGYSQRKAVLVLYGVNFLLATAAGILLFFRNSCAAYMVVALGVLILLGPISWVF